MHINKLILGWVLLTLAPFANATSMTMSEFEDLCGNGNDESRDCVLYVRGLIDGVFERTRQEAWKCECPTPPRADEVLKKLKSQPGDTLFVMSHPFEVFSACVAPEDRGVALDPSKVARALLAKFQEINERDGPKNMLPLNPPSKFLIWVLVDEATASCEKEP